MQDPILEKFVNDIESHLQAALASSQNMQVHVQNTEGDSELFRKLAFYTTPNFSHWISGMQSGNVKDLKETLKRNQPLKKKK